MNSGITWTLPVLYVSVILSDMEKGDGFHGEKERFEVVYSQGMVQGMEIWVDKETGVNYLFSHSGYAGGLTPLLDRDGKPVISPIIKE